MAPQHVGFCVLVEDITCAPSLILDSRGEATNPPLPPLPWSGWPRPAAYVVTRHAEVVKIDVSLRAAEDPAHHREIPIPVGTTNNGKTLTVAVQAGNSFLDAGAVAYMRVQPGIQPVPAKFAHRADIVLILTDGFDDEILAWMSQTADQTASGEGRSCSSRTTCAQLSSDSR